MVETRNVYVKNAEPKIESNLWRASVDLSLNKNDSDRLDVE